MKNNILRINIICILLICLFHINISKAEIIDNAYMVNDENVIYDILEKTEISTFKTNMNLKETETIYSKDNKEVKDGIIGTGMKVTIRRKNVCIICKRRYVRRWQSNSF